MLTSFALPPLWSRFFPAAPGETWTKARQRSTQRILSDLSYFKNLRFVSKEKFVGLDKAHSVDSEKLVGIDNVYSTEVF